LSLAYGILKVSKVHNSRHEKSEGAEKMLNGLNFVLAHVPSIEQVLPFYTEKLGFEIEAQAPGFVQFKQAKGEGATYALSEEGHVEPKASSELWWYVDDAEATQAELQARGVPIVEALADQPFGRTLTIQDPAGNKLNLLQLAQR
jgi:predicted enzyme related to lactoylglutathione lyase